MQRRAQAGQALLPCALGYTLAPSRHMASLGRPRDLGTRRARLPPRLDRPKRRCTDPPHRVPLRPLRPSQTPAPPPSAAPRAARHRPPRSLCTKPLRLLLRSLSPVDRFEAEYRSPVHRDASLHLGAAKPLIDPIEAHRLSPRSAHQECRAGWARSSAASLLARLRLLLFRPLLPSHPARPSPSLWRCV